MQRKNKLKTGSTRSNIKTKGGEKDAKTGDRGKAIDEERLWARDVKICGFTASLLLGLYMRTLHPSVPGGDSGELIISASELGVAHPPGYPLFTICAKLSMLLLPFGSPALRVNLLNAVFSAATAGLLQLIVLRLTNGCLASSLLTTSLFALSKLTWTWSVTAEVFGLNNLFVAVLMLLVVLFESAISDPRKMSKLVTLGTFTCGLALTNQHTVVVYVACIALWVLYRLWHAQALTKSLMGRLVGVFAVGTLPYMYIPIASFLNIARWTWGDQRSIPGLVNHLLRTEYGTFNLGKDQHGLGFVHGIRAYLEHVFTAQCGVGPVLAVAAIILIIVRKPTGQRSSLVLFVGMLCVYTGLFAWRANLDINNALLKGVVERFWMQSDIVVAVLAGVAYSATCRWISEICLGVDHKSNVMAILGATSMIILQLTLNFRACDQSENFVVHDFALRILESMPKNAVIFSKGDLPTNSLRYFHLCQNKRPDLQILDVEVLSYQWSLPMLKKFYPNIVFPGDFWHLDNKQWSDGRKSFNFRSLLDANIDRHELYVCIGMQARDASWHTAYQLWPYGVCERIQRINTLFDSWQWLNISRQFASGWYYLPDQFAKTSWEKVANDEMWHAKFITACQSSQQEHGRCMSPPLYITQEWIASVDISFYC
ncbi:Transmembrane protein 260 [Lamellibrachia satsuma]|nr:Transmembrane protein 260 [Lamellibrachia satsuma]